MGRARLKLRLMEIEMEIEGHGGTMGCLRCMICYHFGRHRLVGQCGLHCVDGGGGGGEGGREDL
jgi:hypothetical protein